MDLGTSAAVCVSILTLGGLVLTILRFIKKDSPKSLGNGESRRLEDRLREEFVSKDSCEGNLKRIEQVMEVTSKSLSKEIETLGKNIGISLDDIKGRLA